MIRIDTATDAAQVIKLQTIRYRTLEPLVHETVDYAGALFAGIVVSAVAVRQSSEPKPAARIRLRASPFPQPIFKVFHF
jgi:hypothetical protein